MKRNETTTGLRVLALLAALGLAGACADSSEDPGYSGDDQWKDTSNWHNPGGGSPDAGSSWPSNDAGASVDTTGPSLPPPPPPEEERDFDLRAPVAGLTRLYIPSAALDALVVVDATGGLAVDLVEVGARPILVRALPEDRGAVVLNSGTADVSIVRIDPTADDYQVETLDVRPHHNRLEISPDGRWAFAWYFPTGAAGEPIGSLQDVSAVRLFPPGEETVFNMAVGLRPEDVFFTSDGRTAIFLCEDGLSGVKLDNLDSDTFLPPVPIHDDLFIKPLDREVVLTPSARYAVVRDLDRAELTMVDLELNQRHVIALPDWPSDLDITPDGGRVVVPFKDRQEVAVLQVPKAFLTSPGGKQPPLSENLFATVSYTGQPFGAVELTADGSRALLYTTHPGTLAVGLVDVATGSVGTRPIPKEVAGARIAPDGSIAVLINRQHSGLNPPESTSNAYTLLDLASGFAYLSLTKSQPTEVLFTPDGDDIYVLLPDPYQHEHEVHRVSDFAVSVYAMPQAPEYVGILEGASMAAVMLDDPTGWLTFIHTTTGEIDQVNSFELNGFIE